MSRTVQRRAWAPPSHAESCACLKRACAPRECVIVKGAQSGLFTPKAPPCPGDWLADGQPGEVDRGGQTMEQ